MANTIPEIVTNKIVVVTNTVSHDVTGLDVVNSVNQLYSGMFNNFLIMITIIAGIVGVLIPILLQRYQRREGQLQEERLNAEFKEQVVEAKREFQAKFVKLLDEQKAIESKLKDAEILISKKVAYANGLAAHIDAVNSFEDGKYYQSSRASIFAIREYLACEEKTNLAKTLNILIACLDRLTKQEFEDEDLKERLLAMEEELKEYKGAKSLMEKIDEYFAAKKMALTKNK